MDIPKTPTFSIIMPAYNAGEYISDSVDSVLNQTYVNFELLICDDGSTDKTRELALQFEARDNRVKFLQNASAGGAGAARNTCIDAASGCYFAFLDADDIWCKTKLEEQFEFIKRTGAEFVISHYKLFSRELNIEAPSNVIDSHWSGGFGYQDLLWKKMNLGCLTVVCKSTLIKDNRMSNIPSGQDYAFWLLLLKATQHAYCYPKVTAFYRVGHSSLSANKIKKIKNIFTVFHKQEEYSFVMSTILSVNYILMTFVLSMKSKLRGKKY